MHARACGAVKEWCSLVGDTAEVLDDEGYSEERPRPTIEIAVDAYRMHSEIQTYLQND